MTSPRDGGAFVADSNGTRPWQRVLAPWVFAVLVVVLLQLAATPFQVSGASMMPYVHDGDLLVANRVAVPARGDVVILATPEDWSQDEGTAGSRIVKRVIGVAGDRISCCDRATGGIAVNGQPLQEGYLASGTAPSRLAFDILVPEGHVWVLGDNRDISRDSRFGLASLSHGAISDADVIGVVWMRLP